MHQPFEDVYGEHVTPVWRYVRARLPSDADAEDVTSETFARAVRSWDAFDAARGTPGAWLLGIARHAVADWWRRRAPEVPVEQTADDADTGDDPEAIALRSDAADHVRRHLGLLTAKEREAVALRFGSGLRAAEVGAVLGVSETAARMLVYRAVSKLREVITDA